MYHQYGIPIAINVGDALHCQMWKLLQKNTATLGFELTFRIFSEFTRASDETVAGQHIELSWVENNQWALCETDYYAMCEKKTSWYTCITPCRLGALIAGAEEEQVDNFISIGANLGIAFQIQDDVLNLIGDEGAYGKEIAGDINEGKRTLVLIHLLNSCTQAENLEVLSIMNKERQEKSESEIKRVLELMFKYNSIRYAQEQAKLLSNKAKQLFTRNLGQLLNQSHCARFLELIDFVIEREY